MKKIFLLFFIVIVSSNAQSQSYHLNVNLQNRRTTSFSIQEVEKITLSGVSTDVKDTGHLHNLMKTFMFFQNYPNPLNPTTTIKDKVPNSGGVLADMSVNFQNNFGYTIVNVSEAMEIPEYSDIN